MKDLSKKGSCSVNIWLKLQCQHLFACTFSVEGDVEAMLSPTMTFDQKISVSCFFCVYHLESRLKICCTDFIG